MRIYATADIHGENDKLTVIKKNIARHRPDLLVMAGDIFNFIISRSVIDVLSGIKIPILGVRGNSDLKWCEKKIKKTPVRILNHCPHFVGDFNLLGLNGTVVLPFASRIGFMEANCIKPLKNRINDKTILVAHPPPKGIRDRVAGHISAGSKGLRSLIEQHPPLLVLCGHIHEQAGVESLGQTPVVNCSMNKKCSGAIIECINNRNVQIKMLTT